MAQNQLDVQQTLRRQLAAQKHQAKFTQDPDDSSNSVQQPTWLQNLYSTVQHQQASILTQKFSDLLKQLPLVAKTNNTAAIDLYLENVIAELAKIYYVRLRVVELNDQIQLAEKNQKKQQLVEECQTRLATVLELLNRLTDHHDQ